MNNKRIACSKCGHKSTEYNHSINKTLVSCLRRLHAMNGKSRLDKMGLTNTQFANFQKLKYFDLAVPSSNNGEWRITDQGIWFLQGRVQTHKTVTTRNGIVIRRSPELVYITDVKDCVEYKIAWRAQAKQPSLFD